VHRGGGHPCQDSFDQVAGQERHGLPGCERQVLVGHDGPPRHPEGIVDDDTASQARDDQPGHPVPGRQAQRTTGHQTDDQCRRQPSEEEPAGGSDDHRDTAASARQHRQRRHDQHEDHRDCC